MSSMLQIMKGAVVRLVGRRKANALSAPYHDWKAQARTRRRLAALPSKGLCVNIGCGPNALPGWINLDAARDEKIDVVWDLSRGLPFSPESCSAIFGEHVIEHIPKEAAENLLKECYRALEPEGVLRLSTPDVELYLRSYAGDREFLHHKAFERPMDSPMDRINQVMREDGQHLWVYDAQSLTVALEHAGFSRVTKQAFGESLHHKMRHIDSEARRFESLYIEALK